MAGCPARRPVFLPGSTPTSILPGRQASAAPEIGNMGGTKSKW